MNVVVREPARDGVGNAEHRRRQELHVENLELGEHNPRRQPHGPRTKVKGLMFPFTLPPPLLHQVGAPLAEVHRLGTHRGHALRDCLGLGEPLHHVHGLVRVEAVHDLGRIPVLAEVNPVSKETYHGGKRDLLKKEKETYHGGKRDLL
jgi:hypothetical protein